MQKNKIIIGSRGSKLALIYAEKVHRELKKHFNGELIIKKIITSGDQNQKDRLANIGGKGLFSKKIEEELLDGNIDLAVHALKDMPSEETEGLETNCFLKRNSPEEVFISKGIKFENLKSNSIIGTSSYRREYQLKKKRSDLNYKLIRGNVDTRIKKLENGEYDGIILSKAGVEALGQQNKITEEFSLDELIPCAGQGIIAIQCRKEDNDLIELLEKINNSNARLSAKTERKVLKILEGDCHTAVGVYSKIEGENLNLTAELFSIDGKKRYFIKSTRNLKLYDELADEIGQKLKNDSKGSYKK